jgi:hypothetical protein
VADSRICTAECAELQARLRVAEVHIERMCQRADMAEAQLAVFMRISETSAAQCARHAAERSQFLQRQVDGLKEQVRQMVSRIGRLAQCGADDVRQRESDMHIARLSAALASALSTSDSVKAERDGLQLELAGTPASHGACTGPCVDARDAAIKDYMNTTVLAALGHGCA